MSALGFKGTYSVGKRTFTAKLVENGGKQYLEFDYNVPSGGTELKLGDSDIAQTIDANKLLFQELIKSLGNLDLSLGVPDLKEKLEAGKKLVDEKDAAFNKLRGEVTALKGDFDAKVLDAETKLKEAKDAAAAAVTAATASGSATDDLNAQITQLQAQIAQLQSDKNGSDQQNKLLSKDLQETQLKLKNSQDEQKLTADELAKAKSRISDLEAEMIALKTQLTSARQNNGALPGGASKTSADTTSATVGPSAEDLKKAQKVREKAKKLVEKAIDESNKKTFKGLTKRANETILRLLRDNLPPNVIATIPNGGNLLDGDATILKQNVRNALGEDIVKELEQYTPPAASDTNGGESKNNAPGNNSGDPLPAVTPVTPANDGDGGGSKNNTPSPDTSTSASTSTPAGNGGKFSEYQLLKIPGSEIIKDSEVTPAFQQLQKQVFKDDDDVKVGTSVESLKYMFEEGAFYYLAKDNDIISSMYVEGDDTNKIVWNFTRKKLSDETEDKKLKGAGKALTLRMFSQFPDTNFTFGPDNLFLGAMYKKFSEEGWAQRNGTSRLLITLNKQSIVEDDFNFEKNKQLKENLKVSDNGITQNSAMFDIIKTFAVDGGRLNQTVLGIKNKPENVKDAKIEELKSALKAIFIDIDKATSKDKTLDEIKDLRVLRVFVRRALSRRSIKIYKENDYEGKYYAK